MWCLRLVDRARIFPLTRLIRLGMTEMLDITQTVFILGKQTSVLLHACQLTVRSIFAPLLLKFVTEFFS